MHKIPDDDSNIATDIAYCRASNKSHSFAELVEYSRIQSATGSELGPNGTWKRGDLKGITIGASYRSLGGVVGSLAASLFWNGITLIFVLINLASTLNLLGFTPPN